MAVRTLDIAMLTDQQKELVLAGWASGREGHVQWVTGNPGISQLELILEWFQTGRVKITIKYGGLIT